MLTYRAAIQTGDTLRALDAVTSVSRYGDWLMDESSWSKPDTRIRETRELPLSEYDVEERLNIRLATPLLKLAEVLPRLGNIHTVWLFNLFITSLCAGLIYLILRAMTYGDKVAVLVSIGAALGTNLWAYSQTFFREPLTTFFILIALFSLQLGKNRRAPGRIISLALAAAGLFLAYEAKHSAALALPALILFALPQSLRAQLSASRRLSVALLALPLMILCFLMLVDALPAALQALIASFGLHSKYLGSALRVYLLSPGASIWGTSPLVLLAIPGCIALWRQGRIQLVLTICLLAFSYTIGHALLTGPHWFGGLSWPPRFLLPILPFLMLATAPVVEAILRRRRVYLRLLWAALLLYGICIQFSGVSLSLRHYSEALPAESRGYSEWIPSLTQPQYFRWVILPQRWHQLGFDFLWTRANLPIWGFSFAAFALLIAMSLHQNLRNPRSRWRHLAPLLAIFCIPLILLNLSSAHDKDPRTQSGQKALHKIIGYLAQNARADDVLLMESNDYGAFILNHLDHSPPRPIILERPLAQAASDRQPAEVVSDNPNDWFEVSSFRIIQHLAGHRDRLWVLADTSPFMAWSFRPLERYLAQHYYPLGTVNLDEAKDKARLLEYSTRSPAPNPLAGYSGDIATDLRYGDHIRLLSVVLPNGARYRPGETVELSLLWQTGALLEHDFTVGWFVADQDRNRPIAQGNDSGPQDGFAPTSAWQPQVPVWDNRALRLPADANSGDYQIWVLLYSFDNNSGETRRLPVSGANVVENGTVGVLPLTLTLD